MKKRVVVLTTPTSATGSLWRIISQLAPAELEKVPFIDHCLSKGLTFDQIRKVELPQEGIFLFNQPHLFNFDQPLDDVQFILNFRDPRDMACNQYHWVFTHPNPSMTEAQLAERRARVKAEGIDKYVMKLDNRMVFGGHVRFAELEQLHGQAEVFSYTQLCLQSTDVVTRLAKLFGNTDDNLIKTLVAKEHPTGLGNNEGWIGNKWSGADIFPGRARVELKPETFEKQTRHYGKILEVLQKLDKPELAFFYQG